ncbi:hypothetical protein BGP_3154 [Beggiatoa sp. PS]|nr:hypothetical protein BGP_3154 [Beggiatoa sp. PS]
MADIDVNKLSIEGYFYPDSFDWLNFILNIHRGSRIAVSANNNGQLCLTIGTTYGKKNASKYFVSSLKLKRKQWYYFKITHNNEGVKFIINDKLEILTRENLVIDKNQVNGNPIFLGGQSFDHRYAYPWKGKISGIKINGKNILWTK